MNPIDYEIILLV